MPLSEALKSHKTLNGSFNDALNDYLWTLSKTVPDSTYLSHQTALLTFNEWRLQQDFFENYVGPKQICDFIEYSLSELQHSVSTVDGYSCSIINFASYYWDEDPIHIKAKSAFYFQQSNAKRHDSSRNDIFRFLDTNSNLAESSPNFCTLLLHYLRQRHFGTRSHVYAELIDNTHSRSQQVRQINVDDLDLINNAVVVGIPNTYVVKKAGLVTERIADLSPRTVEAIEHYLKYERHEQTVNGRRPLLTSSLGRARA